MEYLDKTLQYINSLTPGTKVEIVTIAKDPQRFIDAVKLLIDFGEVSPCDVEFVNNYTYIKKIKPNLSIYNTV